VRRAGTIVAINSNPEAAVFESADIGIVGDWRQVVPALVDELRADTTTLASLAAR
jgi:electron transfer flavoprotein alpha subunit